MRWDGVGGKKVLKSGFLEGINGRWEGDERGDNEMDAREGMREKGTQEGHKRKQ